MTIVAALLLAGVSTASLAAQRDPSITGAATAELPVLPAGQGEPVPPPPPDNWEQLIGGDQPDQMIDGRRRPGYVAPLPDAVTQTNQGAVRPPPPEAFPTDQIPLPDRWRILTGLCPAKDGDRSIYGVFANLALVCHGQGDPYHQNVLKGDRPLAEGKRPGFLKGDDWFLALTGISDTVFEPRTFPIPNGAPVSERPDINIFGKDNSIVASQTFLFGGSLFKGATAFKPPEIEYRLILAYNVNYVNVPERQILSVDPTAPSHRLDHFLGVQEAFIDYHIRNVSDRYDFDSIRIGIQPFQADFRGFLFNDNQLGIRLFGNRDNNRFQYNLAVFWRLEKDTNSGLNTVVERPRDDFVFVANVYRQDFLIPGLTSQVTLVYNRNREGSRLKFDDNGFPIRPALIGNFRPRDYDVFYVGYNVDGHIGRLNLTGSTYGALGRDSNNLFTGKAADIRAFFAAAEASMDVNWARFRLSGLYASGDGHPYDHTENGFDAIFENPIFAGADTSYWIRQSIPFIGGTVGPVALSQRNGVLNSLRSSKDQGQSNFNNPGTILAGAGGDFDLTPQFRLSANANHLWFENVATLQVLRNQANIHQDIGWDLSLSTIWRPKATQNIVFRLSGAMLLPGEGFKGLFTNNQRNSQYYSILANLVLNY
ncbi:MAG TPA: hypothetical protein VF503_22980 [Sphingobium sp.]|uniref:hypothetical protein n=1 Tax=Sphingobium sp. TaxID=1912891 RepID=UPI002ED1C296